MIETWSRDQLVHTALGRISWTTESVHNSSLALGQANLESSLCKRNPHKVQQFNQCGQKLVGMRGQDGNRKVIAPNDHVNLHANRLENKVRVALLLEEVLEGVGDIEHDEMERHIRNGRTPVWFLCGF